MSSSPNPRFSHGPGFNDTTACVFIFCLCVPSTFTQRYRKSLGCQNHREIHSTRDTRRNPIAPSEMANSDESDLGSLSGDFPKDLSHYLLIAVGEPISEDFIGPALAEIEKGKF